jgi:hypothetical protein
MPIVLTTPQRRSSREAGVARPRRDRPKNYAFGLRDGPVACGLPANDSTGEPRPGDARQWEAGA